MEELLLINPSPRRRRKAPAKRRTYRKAAAPARAAAPVRRRRRRAAPAPYLSNPAPRRRRRSAAPAKRRRHTYRRNPSSRGTGIVGMLMGALQGGAGALAVDVIANFLPLPATMKTGQMANVSKAGIAVLIGVLGKKVLPSGVASRMAEGALAVIAHDTLKGVIGPMVPALGLSGLGGLGYFPGGAIPGAHPSSYGSPAALAEYIPQGMAGFNEVSGVGEYVGMNGTF